MNNLNIAIVILVVVILVASLHLFPATCSCVSRSAPWLALVGGGLAVGFLLMASPKPGVYGGASGKRRKGAATRGASKKGKRKGGAEHEAFLDEGEEVDATTVEEIEAFLDEDGNALSGARRSDAAEEADLTGTGADADDAPDSLGAYVVDAPEPSDEEESSSDDE
jgi:hypothetical protein